MNQKTDKKTKGRSWMVLLLTALLIISMTFVAATFFQLIRNAKFEQEWISLATEVQVSSQQLAKLAGEAASGNLEAFTELSTTLQRMTSAMSALNSGNASMDLPPLPPEVATQLFQLSTSWGRMSADANNITQHESLLLSLAEANGEFTGQIRPLQESTDRVARQLTESGAPNQQVFAASRQLVLADRMLRHVNEILLGGSNAVKAASSLGEEVKLFDQVLSALLAGNQSLGIPQVRNQQALVTLGEMRKQFRDTRPHLQTILDSSSGLFNVRGAADEIFLDSRAVFEQAASLSDAIADLPRSRLWPSIKSAGLALAIMIGIVAMLIGSVISAERRRATVATSSNRHNQRAIITLLDELGSLADGDLTVHATVSNEVTGAIADAINYAVERLRELVMGINLTANSVAASAQQTRTFSSKLAEAAGQQAAQMDTATESIKQMAQSFEVMAVRSGESSEAASRSVDIAHSGAKKVRETISGMDNIREQIQETSKRIKRLGESTQEIGDIVSLINGIAEQTNVLALNAAIQAATAGGAGKGFAVVADEVQQLAESATNATKRIETLVQTIQADTSEAVASMESTTTEVVNGTRLAGDAGTALVQVENESNQLSMLIQGIAAEAHEQSVEATKISEIIQSIRDISIQTSTGSQQTASAVENLADLVLELRESVADFKLPESE
ncbi:MAG: twitching motility protein PilJ [Lysobacterales bacterium]|jgi:twitching motility protein PilJ